MRASICKDKLFRIEKWMNPLHRARVKVAARIKRCDINPLPSSNDVEKRLEKIRKRKEKERTNREVHEKESLDYKFKFHHKYKEYGSEKLNIKAKKKRKQGMQREIIGNGKP
jgi:hypothetical protein